MNNPKFHNLPTAGEIPAVTTGQLPADQQSSPYSAVKPPYIPYPPSPAVQQPTLYPDQPSPHLQPIRPPLEPLGSRTQHAIEKYASEIVTALKPQCACETCRNCVKILLSDLVAEIMTDVTIITLALGKQQREFERVMDAISRILPGLVEREGRR